MKLSEELLASLKKHAIMSPTKIQEASIPLIMEGRDIQAQSETGSGKTLAFGLPIMEKAEKNGKLQALIISPTRELAKQIAMEFHKFSPHKLHVSTVYGGMAIEPQIRDAQRSEVIVGTPGRILDLIGRDALNLSKIKWLVLDEADRMLDMGFIDDVEKIIAQTPKTRQTLLFSATLAREILALSRRYLNNPASVDIALKNTDYLLKQFYYAGSKEEKLSILVHLMKKDPRKLVIIFCRTKRTTEWLSRQLRFQNLNSVALNGDMSQNQRERAVREFQEGKFDILIATDVAARGLHINHVSHVYNYDLPTTLESYTHRIGRTARLDKEGSAITLLSEGEDPNVWDRIQRFYDEKIQKLVIEGEIERIRLPPSAGRDGSASRHGRHGGGRGFAAHPRGGRGRFGGGHGGPRRHSSGGYGGGHGHRSEGGESRGDGESSHSDSSQGGSRSGSGRAPFRRRFQGGRGGSYGGRSHGGGHSSSGHSGRSGSSDYAGDSRK